MKDRLNSQPSDDSGPIGDLDDLASRFVDGLLTVDEIPEALRSSVLARAAEFDQLRQSLLRIDSTVDTNPIDAALAAYRQQRSRRIPRSLGTAAAAASILVLSGLVITQIGSDDPQDIMTSDSESALAMAATDQFAPDESGLYDSDSMSSAKTETMPDDSSLDADGLPQASNSAASDDLNQEIIDIASVVELQDFASSSQFEELAQESARELASPKCITDGSQRLITRRARFQGILVEIYQFPSKTSPGTSPARLNVFAQSDCALVASLGT